jgi:hypothetical protein
VVSYVALDAELFLFFGVLSNRSSVVSNHDIQPTRGLFICGALRFIESPRKEPQ